MERAKITALKDIDVSAYVWFDSSVELPPNSPGEEQDRVARKQSAEKQFSMKKGDSRDDVSFVSTVSEAGVDPDYTMNTENPEVGETKQIGDLLRIERLE